MDFISQPWCHTSDFSCIISMRHTLDWYVNELNEIKEYKQCNCSRIRKFIIRQGDVIKRYKHYLVFKCDKCGGHISKKY